MSYGGLGRRKRRDEGRLSELGGRSERPNGLDGGERLGLYPGIPGGSLELPDGSTLQLFLVKVRSGIALVSRDIQNTVPAL